MQTRRIHSTVLISLAMVMFVASGQVYAAGGASGLPDHVPGEVLVTLKSSVTSAVRRTSRIAGVATIEKVSRNLHRIRLQPDATVESMVEHLKKEPMIAHVQPNYIKYMQTNDLDYGQQWGLHNTGQTGGTPGADISAEAAWTVTHGDRNVIVAVLDTGIAGGEIQPHPELRNSLWRNPGEIPDDGKDNDGNGCIDDLIGCDFSDPDNPTGDPVDLDGHGTQVAGVIAAEADNAIGISGVSPGVSLMVINIFNRATNKTNTLSEVAAIDYAIAMGADVINASFGSNGPNCCPGGDPAITHFDQLEYDAIKRAGDNGILVVAPAGNDGIDNDSFLSLPTVPASYSLDNIIAVAATDHNDRLAAFSNWGANSVDLAAPGVAIHTTTLDDGYDDVSGTSLAVGFVTGAVALMLSTPGDHTINGLKNRLLNSTDSLALDQTGKISSGGRLNASAAVLAQVNANSRDRHRQYGALTGGGGISMVFLLLVAATVFRVWNPAEYPGKL